MTALHPQLLPDLFNGDVLVVFGRYTGAGAAAVKVAGTFAGKRREFVADVSFPAVEEDNALRRAGSGPCAGWGGCSTRSACAASRPSCATRSRASRASTASSRPYTAYLVLEDEERRGVPVTLRSFQELRDDREVFGAAKDLMDSVRREAAAPAARSGAGAVANAQAVQELKLGAAESRRGERRGAGQVAPRPADAGTGYRAAQAANYATQVQGGERPGVLPERDDLDRRHGPVAERAEEPAGPVRAARSTSRSSPGTPPWRRGSRWATRSMSSSTARCTRSGNQEE